MDFSDYMRFLFGSWANFCLLFLQSASKNFKQVQKLKKNLDFTLIWFCFGFFQAKLKRSPDSNIFSLIPRVDFHVTTEISLEVETVENLS